MYKLLFFKKNQQKKNKKKNNCGARSGPPQPEEVGTGNISLGVGVRNDRTE